MNDGDDLDLPLLFLVMASMLLAAGLGLLCMGRRDGGGDRRLPLPFPPSPLNGGLPWGELDNLRRFGDRASDVLESVLSGKEPHPVPIGDPK
jgi:hypothetical protein